MKASLATITGMAYLLGASTISPGKAVAAPSNEYLMVWTGDADRQQSDFLAVVDSDEGSKTFGKVVATAPVGSVGNEPHHVPNESFPGGLLFANGFLSSRTFVFDIHDPLKPRLAHVDEPGVGRTLKYAHSYYKRPDGSVVTTYQVQSATGTPPGGLVLLDANGNFVRETTAADPSESRCTILPYGVSGKADIDRLVTTTYSMMAYKNDPLPRENCIQIWRMSDLQLLKTIVLPETPTDKETFVVANGNALTWEPRFLHDKGGAQLFVVTLRGSVYFSEDITAANPQFRVVYDLGDTIAGVPIITKNDKFLIVPLVFENRLVVINIADPLHPHEVGSVKLGVDPLDGSKHRPGLPHFIAINKSETHIAATTYLFCLPNTRLDGERGVYLFDFDAATGKIKYATNFRDEVTGEVGLNFNERKQWPHGSTGPARPHGLMFAPQ
jgi:hypothetical protein